MRYVRLLARDPGKTKAAGIDTKAADGLSCTTDGFCTSCCQWRDASLEFRKHKLRSNSSSDYIQIHGYVLSRITTGPENSARLHTSNRPPCPPVVGF